MKKKLIFCLSLMIIGSFAANEALAHRVTIFAWVDGDTVHTQSKFSGGKRVKNGEINVFDPDGNLLLKGNTNENGEFSFKVPQKTTLKIQLIAGMGHQNEWILSAEELGAPHQESFATSDQAEVSNNVSEKKAESIVADAMTKEDLEQVVEKAVEKKLKPVVQMLSDLSDPGPKLSDILGGIGYIIGLVGIVAYLKNRKKTDFPNR